MHIHSLTDPEFAAYGRAVEGLEAGELLDVLEETAQLPAEGTKYVAEDAKLMALEAKTVFRDRIYGGMPVQLGWVCGRNTKLNCLEYHRTARSTWGRRISSSFWGCAARSKRTGCSIRQRSKPSSFRQAFR